MHVLVGYGVSSGYVFQCCMLARRVLSNGFKIAFPFLARADLFHIRLLVTPHRSTYVLDEPGLVALTWMVFSRVRFDFLATPTLRLANRSHPPPLGGNTMACRPRCVVQRKHLPRTEGHFLRSQSSRVHPSHPELHLRSMHRFLRLPSASSPRASTSSCLHAPPCMVHWRCCSSHRIRTWMEPTLVQSTTMARNAMRIQANILHRRLATCVAKTCASTSHTRPRGGCSSHT